jgi:hypothetical protein
VMGLSLSSLFPDMAEEVAAGLLCISSVDASDVCGAIRHVLVDALDVHNRLRNKEMRGARACTRSGQRT